MSTRRERLAALKAKYDEYQELIPRIDEEIADLKDLRCTLAIECRAMREEMQGLKKKIYYKDC